MVATPSEQLKVVEVPRLEDEAVPGDAHLDRLAHHCSHKAAHPREQPAARLVDRRQRLNVPRVTAQLTQCVVHRAQFTQLVRHRQRVELLGRREGQVREDLAVAVLLHRVGDRRHAEALPPQPVVVELVAVVHAHQHPLAEEDVHCTQSDVDPTAHALAAHEVGGVGVLARPQQPTPVLVHSHDLLRRLRICRVGDDLHDLLGQIVLAQLKHQLVGRHVDAVAHLHGLGRGGGGLGVVAALVTLAFAHAERLEVLTGS